MTTTPGHSLRNPAVYVGPFESAGLKLSAEHFRPEQPRVHQVVSIFPQPVNRVRRSVLSVQELDVELFLNVRRDIRPFDTNLSSFSLRHGHQGDCHANARFCLRA